MLEDGVDRVKQITEQHRTFDCSEHDRSKLRTLIESKGWRLNQYINEFIKEYCGVTSIRLDKFPTIYFMEEHLYEYHDFSLAWQEAHGEHLIPIGSYDLTRLYVADNGKIYGDIRDVDVVQLFGNTISEGMSNLFNNRYLQDIEFEFDEPQFE